jgi:hypothetical protein
MSCPLLKTERLPPYLFPLTQRSHPRIPVRVNSSMTSSTHHRAAGPSPAAGNITWRFRRSFPFLCINAEHAKRGASSWISRGYLGHERITPSHHSRAVLLVGARASDKTGRTRAGDFPLIPFRVNRLLPGCLGFLILCFRQPREREQKGAVL